MAVNIADLPIPRIIEDLTYEQILEKKLIRYQVNNTDYSIYTDSDSIVKILQSEAYDELELRNDMQQAYLQTLTAFATDVFLDHIAVQVNLPRLVLQEANTEVNPPVEEILESNEAFRDRIITTIDGLSPAGSGSRYRSIALGLDPKIKDINVIRPAKGQVKIIVLSTEGTGVPDDTLLTKVRNYMTQFEVQMLTDDVTVTAATKVDFDVTATIHLRKDAAQSTFDTLAATFTNEYNTFKGLGNDVTLSWITSKLHQSGVHSVVLSTPSGDVLLNDEQFGNLVNLTLTQGVSKT